MTAPVAHLLDVNALIALVWTAHEHHPVMAAWFNRHADAGWATTAFTQSGLIRILSQPALSRQPVVVTDVVRLMLKNTAHPAHRFVPLDFDFATVLGTCTGGLHGHRQVTDAYLLTTAMRNGMKLLTFDTGLPQLLASATERQHHVLVLGQVASRV